MLSNHFKLGADGSLLKLAGTVPKVERDGSAVIHLMLETKL